ncbi:MAG: DUF177 domain-containing protein [Oscillospiraceae bacterium]|nr:DUF177 domain-containing protein [Oscillospiraceae bacterium]
MIIQLKQLFDIVGERKELDFVIPSEELSEYQQYEFVSGIAINGTIVNRAGVVTLSFSCSFTMNQFCDRCLCEFNREYAYDFEHILVRSSSSDDFVECPDNTLDINELAISDLLLQLPTKILCKDDCKGLCFKCGADLNEGPCGCPEG